MVDSDDKMSHLSLELVAEETTAQDLKAHNQTNKNAMFQKV